MIDGAYFTRIKLEAVTAGFLQTFSETPDQTISELREIGRAKFKRYQRVQAAGVLYPQCPTVHTLYFPGMMSSYQVNIHYPETVSGLLILSRIRLDSGYDALALL